MTPLSTLLAAPLAIIEFLEPQRLWFVVLIPVLVIGYLLLNRRGGAKKGRTDALSLMLPKQRGWVRHAAVGLAILSLATLTIAYAKPKQTVLVPRERATIVVAIDVSLSMQAEDVEPTRLASAQSAAKDFVQTLPPKYNVALVSFAGTAATLVPPTTDRGPVLAGIDNLKLQPSTAIGEGIYTSLATLAQTPPDPDDPGKLPPARIVLLSDGKTTIGRTASAAAQESKDQDVPIYTIAYGTATGYVEIRGRREPVPVDKAELNNVAKVSGGEAYTAASAGELKNVYKDIGSSVGKERVDQEVTSRYAGAGLAFAVLAALGVASIAARWP